MGAQVAAYGNRLQASVRTFALPGRLFATFIVLIPMAFCLYGGLFSWPGLVVYGFWVLPKAWRDIWQRAVLPEDDLIRLREESKAKPEPAPREEYIPMTERPAPKRW